jgi:hypothetical protein
MLAFADWLLYFSDKIYKDYEVFWRIEIETHVVEDMTTEQAYKFWKNNVKK